MWRILTYVEQPPDKVAEKKATTADACSLVISPSETQIMGIILSYFFPETETPSSEIQVIETVEFIDNTVVTPEVENVLIDETKIAHKVSNNPHDKSLCLVYFFPSV